MPLASEFPVIDDRRYADLVAEARTRIPRYASEWNDLNDNEPGMAVVQVLAWLTELLVHRLGLVPKLNYLKFLELIGIELDPARAAAVDVSFPVVATFTEPTVIVPLHTQVAAEIPGLDTPIVFETERALIALQARLASVQLDSGFDIVDASAANDDAQTGFACFGQTARLGSALMLGFDSALDFPSVVLDLMFWVKTARARGPVYADCTTTAPPPATIAWEYWNGAEWQPLDLLKDETVAFTRSGHVSLLAPSPKALTGPLQRAALGQVPDLRYWIRARLVDGAYQRAPQLLAARTNTVPALQAQTVDAEALGRATGLDDQVFTLANNPVLAGTLKLVIDEGRGEEDWDERPDFFASGSDDRHYVLNRSTGEVRFGRGKQMRVPIANPNRPVNVIALAYRFGGAAAGNVGAGTLTNLRGNVAGIDAGGVTNLMPAYGGSDEETLDAARERASQTLKSHDRAVTTAEQAPMLKQYGLTPALMTGAGTTFQDGLIRKELHGKFEEAFHAGIDLCANVGCPTLIAMPGERRGMPREEAADNAAAILTRVKGYAEQKGVTLCMEITNSKVVADQRTDQTFNHLEWGWDVYRKVNSPRVKIVYDMYHVQIMDGDVTEISATTSTCLPHSRRGCSQPPGDRRHAGAQLPLHRQRDRGPRLHGFRRPRYRPTPGRDPIKSLEQCFEIMNV